jgi:hypothetical protein
MAIFRSRPDSKNFSNWKYGRSAAPLKAVALLRTFLRALTVLFPQCVRPRVILFSLSDLRPFPCGSDEVLPHRIPPAMRPMMVSTIESSMSAKARLCAGCSSSLKHPVHASAVVDFNVGGTALTSPALVITGAAPISDTSGLPNPGISKGGFGQVIATAVRYGVSRVTRR